MSNNVEMKKEERYSRVPKFNPRQMDKWELFLKAHLKRDQAESALTEVKPTVDADKQATLHGDAEEGELSKDERIYLKWVRQEEEKWVKKNAIAYSAIVESCGEHAGAMVVILGRQGNDNAKELFDALMRKYRVQSTAILQMELAHFHGMTMGSSESGLDYIDRIENSKVKLIQMGHHALIDDVDLVGRLVVGMRNNSKYVGLSDTFRMVRDLTWQYAVEQVTVFDTQSSSNLQTTSVKAHMVKHKPFKKGGRNKGDVRCHRCGKMGHFASDCYSTHPLGENSGKGAAKGGRKFAEQGDDHTPSRDNQRCNGRHERYTNDNKKRKLQCWVCGEDHRAAQCPKRYDSTSSRATYTDTEARQSKFGASAYMLRKTQNQQHSIKKSTTDCHVFALDSAATVHIVNSNAISDGTVLQEEYTSIQTASAGDSLESQYTCDIGNMKHVRVVDGDKLDTNLASVRRFDEAGCKIIFQNGSGTVYGPDGDILITAELKEDLYMFDVRTVKSAKVKAMLASTAPKESLPLWHKRAGHRNNIDLATAIKHKMITGIPEEIATKQKPQPLCDPCARAKSTRYAFDRVTSEKTPITVLTPLVPVIKKISTDIKGPFAFKGDEGQSYYQGFIDNETKWVYVYFMKTRSEAFENVKDLCEVQLAREGLSLLVYQSDGAPELISRHVVHYLSNRKTSVVHSSPYTPELNAMIERNHRTIFEMANALLLASVVPMKLWTYAVRHSAYLFNRLPTETAEGNKTPYEAKYGVVPDVSRWKIFGCICYAHIPDELRPKGFVDKAYKAYFLGFSETCTGAIVYDIVGDRVMTSSHVTFDEVTVLTRDYGETLDVLPDTATVEDYKYLEGQVFRDDDSEVLYVTTRVAVQRKYVVAFVALVSQEGLVGQEEMQPIHAPDVARMLKMYHEKEGAWIIAPGGMYKLGHTSTVQLDGVNSALGYDTGDDQRTTSDPEIGSADSDVMPMQRDKAVERGGTDHPSTSELGRRARKRRELTNVSKLGDTSTSVRHAKMSRIEEELNYEMVCDSDADELPGILSESEDEEEVSFFESRKVEIFSHLVEKHVWEIKQPEQGVQVIPCRWVDKLKNPHDKTSQKSRLVVRGD